MAGIVEDAEDIALTREGIYNDLDRIYFSNGRDLLPAVRLAKEEDEDLEDIVIGYIERMVQYNPGQEQNGIVEEAAGSAHEIAQKVAEDYKRLMEINGEEVGDSFQDIYDRLEED